MKCSRTLTAIVCRHHSSHAGKSLASETKPRLKERIVVYCKFAKSGKESSVSKKKQDFVLFAELKGSKLHCQHPLNRR